MMGSKENEEFVTTVPYTIHSWSSHSADYHPKNIMSNQPNEQSSRWSSERNDRLQYITIQLEQVSMIHSITFGKYCKVHVCNLKEFKIFGGMSTDHMLELCHTGLKNNDQPERFPLRRKFREVEFPCKFIKLVPLLAWGANFNFSIWYVQLHGISEPSIVNHYLSLYNQFRERETIRLCLKYFRQKHYVGPFEMLQNTTQISLEDPQLTKLHAELVLNGNFEECEKIIIEASKNEAFSDFLSSQSYQPTWTKLKPVDTNGQITSNVPCLRGGHQMTIDYEDGIIYLFGGWDGEKDLGDFWAYKISENRWVKICDNTQDAGGPSPRSCHNICFEPRKKRIYCLGRYVDIPNRQRPGNTLSDFYMYDVAENRWHLISNDTAAVGGPNLIFDHQMQLNVERGVIIIFGGRTITSSEHLSYSGMFYYYYGMNLWTSVTPKDNEYVKLKSRTGHSLLCDSKNEDMYIFSGQNTNEHMSDFFIYNLESQKITQAISDTKIEGGPEASFTQRATIDPEKGEIYVFGMKDRATKSKCKRDHIKNSFWVYSIPKRQWSKLHMKKEKKTNERGGSSLEPPPRFGHQMVFDQKNKVHYLFGGNTGVNRLNDFWSLRFWKPENEDIVKKALFFIRKQRFMEICVVDKTEALQYLQNNLAETVDQNNEKQAKEFRSLTANLFNFTMAGTPDDELIQQSRTEVYENLLKFFPAHMKQPEENLVDLITEN